jgi:hypothetical protein
VHAEIGSTADIAEHFCWNVELEAKSLEHDHVDDGKDDDKDDDSSCTRVNHNPVGQQVPKY